MILVRSPTTFLFARTTAVQYNGHIVRFVNWLLENDYAEFVVENIDPEERLSTSLPAEAVDQYLGYMQYEI